MLQNSEGLSESLSAKLLKPNIQLLIDVLEEAGHEAWLVGGCVRDAVLGKSCHDVDITTSAHWTETARVLKAASIEVHETGTEHGTVTAILNAEPIEITSFRVEANYQDHRHPSDVRFVRSVTDDLGRRDFTINAMAWHPQRGFIDPFGGLDDLASRCIRAVGNPDERFSEDALRLLRAVRFSCRLAFSIEKNTQEALTRHAAELAYVAHERIGTELNAIICSGRGGQALCENTDLMCAALPELVPMRGFDQQSIYHIYDVLEHTAAVMRGAEAFAGGCASPALAWAALLHDVGKPSCFTRDAEGKGHFFGHPASGAGIARKILQRLALPRRCIRECCTLIRFHDYRLSPTASSLRELLRKLEAACPGRAKPLAYELLCLKRADACAKARACAEYVRELDETEALLRYELAHNTAWSLHMLELKGSDMLELGYTAGPEIGRALNAALDAVIAGDLSNTRHELRAWASAYRIRHYAQSKSV